MAVSRSPTAKCLQRLRLRECPHRAVHYTTFSSRSLNFIAVSRQKTQRTPWRERGVLLLMNVLLQGPICIKPSDCWEAPVCTLFMLRMPAKLKWLLFVPRCGQGVCDAPHCHGDYELTSVGRRDSDDVHSGRDKNARSCASVCVCVRWGYSFRCHSRFHTRLQLPSLAQLTHCWALGWLLITVQP